MPLVPPPKLAKSTNWSPRIGVLMRRLLVPVAFVFPTKVLSVNVRDPPAPAAMVKLPLKPKTKFVLTGAVRVAVDPPGAAFRLTPAPFTQVEVYGPDAAVPQIAVVVFQSPEVRAGSQKRSCARSPGAMRSVSRNDITSRRPEPLPCWQDIPLVSESAEPAVVLHRGTLHCGSSEIIVLCQTCAVLHHARSGSSSVAKSAVKNRLTVVLIHS